MNHFTTSSSNWTQTEFLPNIASLQERRSQQTIALHTHSHKKSKGQEYRNQIQDTCTSLESLRSIMKEDRVFSKDELKFFAEDKEWLPYDMYDDITYRLDAHTSEKFLRKLNFETGKLYVACTGLKAASLYFTENLSKNNGYISPFHRVSSVELTQEKELCLQRSQGLTVLRKLILDIRYELKSVPKNRSHILSLNKLGKYYSNAYFLYEFDTYHLQEVYNYTNSNQIKLPELEKKDFSS